MPGSDEPNTGLQLWVNLPREKKMVEPAYQELLDKDVPRAKGEGVEVKVIAGESLGVSARVRTQTPICYLDVRAETGKEFKQPIEIGWNVMLYVLEGKIKIGEKEIEAHHTVVFEREGDHIAISAVEASRFVVIGGKPIEEPVVQHGPFVMNTREEIMQTFMDYQTCRNGFEKARSWESQIGKRAMY